MMDSRTQALAAFEAALRQANLGGLRDLHEGLQTGALRVWGFDKTQLATGTWGVLGDSHCNEPSTACPLSALFLNDAHVFKGGIGLAAEIAAVVMAREGYVPSDFYVAWDRGRLAAHELRDRVEAHMTSDELAGRRRQISYEARRAGIARLVLARRRVLEHARQRQKTNEPDATKAALSPRE